jgi:hypothetical protein
VLPQEISQTTGVIRARNANATCAILIALQTVIIALSQEKVPIPFHTRPVMGLLPNGTVHQKSVATFLDMNNATQIRPIRVDTAAVTPCNCGFCRYLH